MIELLGLTSYPTVERSPVFMNTVDPESPQSHAEAHASADLTVLYSWAPRCPATLSPCNALSCRSYRAPCALCRGDRQWLTVRSEHMVSPDFRGHRYKKYNIL